MAFSPRTFRRLTLTGLFALSVTGALVAQTQPVLPPLDPRTLDDSIPVHPKILVKSFRFEGNTAVSTRELEEAVKDFTNKELTNEGIEEARRAATLVYVRKGFINSGAILPDQDIAEGIITLRIVEGKLNEVHLEHIDPRAAAVATTQPATVATTQPTSQPTTQPVVSGYERLRQRLVRRLNDSYLLPRIWRDRDEPLNVLELRNNLELLRQNPNVRRINAELRPGVAPGESELEVQVEENNPWQLALNFNNRRSPSVGGTRFELFASNSNLLGMSDLLSFRYGLNKGGLRDFEFSEFDDFSIDYSIPVTSYDTRLFMGYTRSDEPVVEEPFADLEISSISDIVGVGVRQPFFRTPNSEFALSLALSVRQNQTELLDEDFSFPPFREEGESNSSAIRFAQEYSTRNTNRAIALRSTFSFGIDAFDATIADDDRLADSEFFAWLGQLQYVRRIGESDNQFVFRVTTQLTPDPLLSVEQFPIGGMDTVRGYRENQLVRDNAVVGTAELRIPLIRKADRSVLDFAPFFDVGYGWNDIGEPDDELISSAGIGFLWNPNKHVSGQIYWGFPFRKFEDESDDEDLQDWGIHFSLTVFAF